jgi:acetyl-CoA hydrolase
MLTASYFPRLTADEAAAMIFNGATVGYSGFTPAGAAKATPRALAARTQEMSERGEPMLVRILSASGAANLPDDELGETGGLDWPATAARVARSGHRGQRFPSVDMQSSQLPQMVEFGLFGDLDLAVIEAIDVVRDGRVYLTTSGGPSPSFLRHATKVIIEINHRQSSRLVEMHDVSVLPQPPYRSHIPIETALDRIGTPYVAIDPKKIVGVVETDEPDDVAPYDPPDEISDRIADHIGRFLHREANAGRIPPEFLPLQAGGGSLVNSVVARLGASEDIPPFHVYGDVFQDAMVDLMEYGRLRGASATSLTLTPSRLRHLFANMDFFAPRFVLRPQEISNNLSVLQRLGIIAINSVLEADVLGCANATSVCGTNAPDRCGSGDFVRCAYLSFLITPSVGRGGGISAIVPMVSHVDHSEHTVQILVTEQGLADLRGLDRTERAQAIISQCAHPLYRDYLYDYVQSAPLRRLPHDFGRCFELHRNLMATGSMLPAAAGA